MKSYEVVWRGKSGSGERFVNTVKATDVEDAGDKLRDTVKRLYRLKFAEITIISVKEI